MNKYLFLYRSPKSDMKYEPSPEEMEGMFKAWAAWKEKFKENVADMGDGLKQSGRVLQTNGDVTDGPFIEAKEVLGGFSIILADTYEQALEIAKACPIREMPGNTVEVREMAGF